MSDARWRSSRFHKGAVVCGGVFFAVTAVLLVGRLSLDSLERTVLLGSNFGLLVVLALPLLLAVTSLRRRPVLLVPAAIFSILVSPVMWSGLPLVFIPGVVYGIAYLKSGRVSLSGVQIVASIVVPLALGVASFAALFADSTYECAEERTANGGRSVCADVPSTASVAGVVLLVTAAAAGGAYASMPSPQPRDPARPVPIAQP